MRVNKNTTLGEVAEGLKEEPKGKTIEHWFKSVADKKLRKQLLANVSNIRKNRVCSSLADAIRSGFAWEDSNETDKYWSCIYAKAEKGEIKMREPKVKWVKCVDVGSYFLTVGKKYDVIKENEFFYVITNNGVLSSYEKQFFKPCKAPKTDLEKFEKFFKKMGVVCVGKKGQGRTYIGLINDFTFTKDGKFIR